MAAVTIPYTPRRWALTLHHSFKRYFSLIIHRRGGKTTGLINHLQRAATDDQWEADRMRSLVPDISGEDLTRLMSRRFYGLVFPTYTQAKLVAWDALKFYAAPIPGMKTNESELMVQYPNGSKLRLFGADRPDALRGTALWGLGFDEYSQQPSNIFSEVLSKSLADHLGFSIFAGTIKGKNQLYRTHEIAKQNPNEWGHIWQDVDETLKTEDDITVRLIRQAIEDDRKLVAQGMMTQEEFDQEWYLSAEAAVKGAYYARYLSEARRQGRIGVVNHDPALKVHTCWDLGKGQNMAVGFYQRSFNQVRKIDYLEGGGDDGLPQVIAKVKSKPYVYGKHFGPHDIRAVDISTGKTRLETAKSLGIDFEVIPMIPVDDGIEAGKRMFARLWVDEKRCQAWLDSMAQYHQEWDEKRGMFKDNPFHDWSSHGADEYRGAAVIEDRMTNDDPKPYRPIINTPVTEFEQGVDPLTLHRRQSRRVPEDDPVSEYEGAGSRPWSFDDSMNL